MRQRAADASRRAYTIECGRSVVVRRDVNTAFAGAPPRRVFGDVRPGSPARRWARWRTRRCRPGWRRSSTGRSWPGDSPLSEVLYGSIRSATK